jgi:O-acetyl-ADP-ribose deacetylase
MPQFLRRLHPGTELIVGVRDILSAPTHAIVNPANSGLSHGGGLAADIAKEAGESMEQECEAIIRKLGRVPKTQAVLTKAGRLPYQCIIHAVGPRMGDGDEQGKIETTILNVMQLALDTNLTSVAFPAISTGIYGVPKELCAKAFLDALDQFWRDESHRMVKLVWLCMVLDDYPIFEKIMKIE